MCFLTKSKKLWYDMIVCVCLPGLSFAQYSHQHKFLCVNMATFWIWDLLQFCKEILSHKQLCIQMKELLSGSFEICDDLHVHEKVKAIYAEIIMSLQMTYPLWHIKMQTNSTIECIFGNAWHISVLNICFKHFLIVSAKQNPYIIDKALAFIKMLLMYLSILPQCYSVFWAQLFQLPHDTVSYIWNT